MPWLWAGPRIAHAASRHTGHHGLVLTDSIADLAVCAAGYYKDPTSGKCTICIGGGSTSGVNTAPTCSCPKTTGGSYDTGNAVSYNPATGCPCATGYTNDANLECNWCQADYFKPAGACQLCPPGSHTSVNNSASACQCTDTGYAGGDSSATSCTCATGYKQDTRSFVCTGDSPAPLSPTESRTIQLLLEAVSSSVAGLKANRSPTPHTANCALQHARTTSTTSAQPSPASRVSRRVPQHGATTRWRGRSPPAPARRAAAAPTILTTRLPAATPTAMTPAAVSRTLCLIPCHRPACTRTT